MINLPLSQAWWLTMADQELYKHCNMDNFTLNLPAPLFKTHRVTAFFDGSVRLAPLVADMCKPL